MAQLTPNIESKATNKQNMDQTHTHTTIVILIHTQQLSNTYTQQLSNTYTHNNCHTQTNKTWIKHIHKQTKHGSKTYTHNNCHTQTSKKAVSQYNKRNQVPPVLSSKDRLIKEPKDFTCCEEVELRIFSIL